MEQLIGQVINVSDLLWGGTWGEAQLLPFPPMVVLLLGSGLYMMVGLRFLPLRDLGRAMADLFRRQAGGRGEISPFAALSTALSGQVGTGNLAGVATAITLGGPGAIFWMWVTALIGMALAFAEGALAIRFREKGPDGQWRGGPMTYILMGLGPGWGWLAVLFSVGTLFSALVTGNAIQSNSVADSIHGLTGLPDWVGGLLTAALVFIVIVGGIRSIGAVAERIVPAMAGAYLVMALAALVLNWESLPETFSRILAGAFAPQAASGGFLGAAVIVAIRAGVARGLFSNEAGQGSTPMAHAVARTEDPATQGRFAMMGTFIDTLVVCTLTALVILTVEGSFTHAGTSVPHAWQSDLEGFAMTSGAFAAAFPWTVAGVPLGALIASIALILFVFTTLVTWSYYGERAATFLYERFGATSGSGERRLLLAWRLLWCVAIVIGSFQDLTLVWRLGDIMNAAMALPNLVALLLLSGVVFALARGERTAGLAHPVRGRLRS
ncbi:alanine/glycine:cation symporter family protein [Thermaurantiacus sp.]